MLEQISTRFTLMLLDVSLKAILLWTLALLAVRVFRRMSVHSQHRVWTVVLLAMLALPILKLTGPSWSLPAGNWLPQARSLQTNAIVASAATNSVAEDRQIRAANSLNVQADGVPQALPDFPVTPNGIGDESRIAQSTRTMRTDLDQVPAKSTAADPWGFEWPSMFVVGSIVWLVGVSIMLARFTFALIRVRRIQRAARFVTDIKAT